MTEQTPAQRNDEGNQYVLPQDVQLDTDILAGLTPEDAARVHALTDVAQTAGTHAMHSALKDYLQRPFSTADELRGLRAQALTTESYSYARQKALEAAAGVSGYNRGILYRLPPLTGIVKIQLELDESYRAAKRKLQTKPNDSDLFRGLKIRELAALATAPLLTDSEKKATMHRWRLRTTKLKVQ